MQHNRKRTQHIICICSSVAISDGLYYQCANTTAGCEHQKQQKQKQQNRNSTQHRIIVHLHPLPCRSIVVRIGARTLHLSRHLASVLAPCIFLVCLSDGRTGLLFEFVCAIRTLIIASSPCRVCRDQPGMTMVSPLGLNNHGYHHIG